MTLIRALLAVLTLAAVAPIGATSSHAETYRPWCVQYGGGGRGGGTNCGFISFEQCMMTSQGSDVCRPNPFYQGQNRSSQPNYDSWEGRRRR